MDDVFDLVLSSWFVTTATCLLVAAKMKKKKRRHRFWVRQIFHNREKYGYNASLLRELRLHDQEYYFDFMRMTPEIFDWLLLRVEPLIKKKDTRWRKSIPPNERLALTLRFLATGETYRSLSFAFPIGRTTVGKIIFDTCSAIWESMVVEFMPFPDSAQAWNSIAQGFLNKWQLPHCCGAIDGKHVIRECPPNTGSLYYNYKGAYSSVLMAVCDAYYRFIMIDFGHYGSESDGGIFRKTILGRCIINSTLNLPQPAPLPNSNGKVFPFFFVGDEAFPLCTNLLRPYPRAELSYTQRICNYRLSRGRRVVENAFGILAARFRIFRRPLSCSDSATQKMVLAACVLHNILIQKCSSYLPKDYVDTEDENYSVIPGDWRRDTQNGLRNVGQCSSNMYSKTVKHMRDEYKDYLVHEGAVPWQHNAVTNCE